MVSPIRVAPPLARAGAAACSCRRPAPASKTGSEVDGHARLDAAALADVVRPIGERGVCTLADLVAVPLPVLVHRAGVAVARGHVDLDAVEAIREVDDTGEHAVAEVRHLPLLA